MNPFVLVLLMLIVQIAAYFLFARLKLRWARHLLPLGIIALHLFVFPRLFYPENPNNEPKCGMPIFGIIFFFLMIGCGSTVICHLFYYVGSKTFAVIADRSKKLKESSTGQNTNLP